MNLGGKQFSLSCGLSYSTSTITQWKRIPRSRNCLFISFFPFYYEVAVCSFWVAGYRGALSAFLKGKNEWEWSPGPLEEHKPGCTKPGIWSHLLLHLGCLWMSPVENQKPSSRWVRGREVGERERVNLYSPTECFRGDFLEEGLIWATLL
jgi:hypothetical protein